MNCKNCNFKLNSEDNFCNNCGAKVIKERITVKSLFSHFLNALGWDSNFFVTFRFLLAKPQVIIKEYINGTRKKYTNPFTFFAISLAISLFVFNQFSEDFILLNIKNKIKETNELENISSSIKQNNDKVYKMLGFKNEASFQKWTAEFELKYHNLISFLFLPIFTLIAFLVFRKPYNYGEHLVINAYFLGITSFFGILFFISSIITKSSILLYANISTFIYYSYAYKKVYELSFGKLLLKILKFFGVLISVIIVGGILSVLVGYVLAMIKLK